MGFANVFLCQNTKKEFFFADVLCNLCPQFVLSYHQIINIFFAFSSVKKDKN